MLKVLIGGICNSINFLIGDVAKVDTHIEPAVEKDFVFFRVRDLMLQFSAYLVIPSGLLLLFFLLLVSLGGLLRMVNHIRVPERFIVHYWLGQLLFLWVMV